MKFTVSPRILIVLFSTIAAIWLIIVLISAKGVNVTSTSWNFANTAQLGDSFGVISSLMASIAAYFAYATYRSAKEEAKIAERRAAEPSFLNLLERRFDVLDRIRFSSYQQTNVGWEPIQYDGQYAIDKIATKLLREFKNINAHEERERKYWEIINKGVSGLTNYHRFVFHVIAFSERQFSNIDSASAMTKSDPSYSYIKLLRAQFSDNEMRLMAINAAYGDGYPKLKHYIERYALLNNIDCEDIESLKLREIFEDQAFGMTPEDRPFDPDSPVVEKQE